MKSATISAPINQISPLFANIASIDIVLPSNTQNNESLELFSDSTYVLAKAVKYLSIAVSALSLLLFVAGYFGAKLIAIECIAVVQLSAMLLFSLENMPPTFAALKPLTLSMGLTPLPKDYVYEQSTLSPNFKFLLLNRDSLSCLNAFLALFVAPVIAAAVIKLLADRCFKEKQILQFAWKNALGTHAFYALLFLAYANFCYLFVDVAHFAL